VSQTAPPAEKSGKQASSPLVPPEERFWQRYSPHAEFPLSSTGSLVLHLLAFGLLGLMAWLGTVLFSHVSRQLPVEAVRLAGGGGNPRGQGDGPNTGAPIEAGSQTSEAATANAPPADVPPPKIEVNADPLPQPQFDEPGRQIQKTDDSSRVFTGLSQRAAKIQLPGSRPSGYGKGGTGSGGGSGSGKGSGVGRGTNAGAENFTQRQKRHARWDMLLGPDSKSASGYVRVLHSLGAILAIPVRESGDGFDYMIVRDLSARPAKLLKEDFLDVCKELGAEYYWLEDKPINVKDILSILRIPTPKIAPDKLHFIALLPAKFEEKLFRLEIDFLNKRYPGHSEDDIERTKFQLKGRNGNYEPEVVEQKLKK
jgi:hypothetical protein